MELLYCCVYCSIVLFIETSWCSSNTKCKAEDWELTFELTNIIGHYNPSVRIIDSVSHATYVVCINFIHKWRDLQFKVDSELTYIISHYNPSVRIIDPVSHTTYVVCINFIHKWRDLQFKVDSERQIFWDTFRISF